MKTSLTVFIFIVAAGHALAQTSAPILPQIPGSLTSGTITLSGCVSGGIGYGLITMMSPTIGPSPARAASGLQPAYRLPPAWSTTPAMPILPPSESGAVATYGTIASGSLGVIGTAGSTAVGAVGTFGSATAVPPAPSGYFLTGSDMSSWVGRRVQVEGTLTSSTIDIYPAVAGAASPPFLQEFRVLGVVPLIGACPQP